MVRQFKPKVRELKDYIKSNKFLLCPTKSKLKKKQMIIVLNAFGIHVNQEMESKELKRLMRDLKNSTCTKVGISKQPKENLLEIAKRFQLARQMLSDGRNLSKVSKIYGHRDSKLDKKINKFLKTFISKVMEHKGVSEEKSTQLVPYVQEAVSSIASNVRVKIGDFVKYLDASLPRISLSPQSISYMAEQMKRAYTGNVLNTGTRRIAPEFDKALVPIAKKEDDQYSDIMESINNFKKTYKPAKTKRITYQEKDGISGDNDNDSDIEFQEEEEEEEKEDPIIKEAQRFYNVKLKSPKSCVALVTLIEGIPDEKIFNIHTLPKNTTQGEKAVFIDQQFKLYNAVIDIINKNYGPRSGSSILPASYCKQARTALAKAYNRVGHKLLGRGYRKKKAPKRKTIKRKITKKTKKLKSKRMKPIMKDRRHRELPKGLVPMPPKESFGDRLLRYTKTGADIFNQGKKIYDYVAPIVNSAYSIYQSRQGANKKPKMSNETALVPYKPRGPIIEEVTGEGILGLRNPFAKCPPCPPCRKPIDFRKFRKLAEKYGYMYEGDFEDLESNYIAYVEMVADTDTFPDEEMIADYFPFVYHQKAGSFAYENNRVKPMSMYPNTY